MQPAAFDAGSAIERWLPETRAAKCDPVEIAPGRWFTPLCRSLPAVRVRRFVRPFGFDGDAIPRSVDLRNRGLVGPIGDQGGAGVCWAFALATVMDSAARKAGHHDAVVAPLHVVAKKQWSALWGRGRGAPLTVESVWPYDEGKACAFDEDNGESCGVAEAEPGSWRRDPALRHELSEADRQHRYRFRDVEQLEVEPANIEQLASVLAEGDAIWAAFRFNGESWSQQAARDGVFEDYEDSKEYPGHAVAIVGYRTTLGGKQFIIKNSWGTDWGHGGYAWMPERTVRKHLYRAFRLGVAATTNEPGDRRENPPQPHACAAGQVRDLMTGACSAPCAGVFPPVNGVCAFGGSTPSASSACPAGQLRDAISGACTPKCASGFPAAMGLCLP